MKLFVEETDIYPSYNIENISPRGEMLFFDIETTGLKKETTQIYMIGCGYFNAAGNFEIRQWMTESAADEKEVLFEFLDFAKDYSVLVHFNGDGFDIPYVDYKAEFYGVEDAFLRFESFDIYKKVKGYKKFLGLERMNQKSVESFLGIERRDRMNGGILIPYYFEYERSSDPECERLLLLHNNDDVRGMLLLCDMLSYTGIFEGRYRVRNEAAPVEVFEDTCILEFTLDDPVPIPVLYERGGLMIAAEGDLLQVNIKLYEGTARIPLANVEDYYYLPAEDRVIHKDVAEFVDRKFRKKATKKNCFIKKEGRFVPVFGLDCVLADPVCYISGEKGKLIPCIKEEDMLNASLDAVWNLAKEVLSKVGIWP